MPATKVPWPRPSPGELPGSVVRFTFAAMRPANSGRVASMPESTIAIVAAGAAGLVPLAQYFCTPVTNGHFSFVVVAAAAVAVVEERRTGASAVIAVTCLWAATARIWAPVRATATPSIEVKVRAVFSERPRTSATACAAWLPPLPWTITENVSAGRVWAETRSPGATKASTFFGPGTAAALSGNARVRASVASSAVRRFPLPQSAFEREPVPRLPLPQSALARTSRRWPPLLINLLPSPQLTNRNVGSGGVTYLTRLR